MTFDFTDRTVVVTGAGHGFGRAMVLGFARAGARVFGCDIARDALGETRSLAGASCTLETVDVTDRAAVHRFVTAIEAQSPTGAVDVLVNNAGGVCGQVGRPLEEVEPADWQAVFDVNVTGAFYCAQAVAPGMKRCGSGRIINISSGAGVDVSLTGIQAYASAKAGQIGLTRQLAHELGAWGITVNTVAPGFVRSNPTSERQWQAMGEAGQRRLVDGLKLKRLGSADDIANAVMFFASDEAGWITGQVLSVDGGR